MLCFGKNIGKKVQAAQVVAAGLVLLSAFTLSGCGKVPADEPPDLQGGMKPTQDPPPSISDKTDTDDTADTATQTTVEALPTLDTGYSKFDLNADETTDGCTTIVLADDKTSVTGNGALWKDGVLTINAAGTYVLSGKLSDGRVMVAAEEDDKVRLVLNGVDITSTAEAPLIIAGADKAALILASGSENRITDARAAVTDDTADAVENKAAISAQVSLTINGNGSLVVTGGCRNGISTKKNLRIVNGTLSIEAQNVGLKGKNSVSICGGEITVRSGGDCIKTEESDNTAKGFVDITGGSLTLVTDGDGISASQYFLMSGGSVDVTTAGEVTPSGSGDDRFGGFFGQWRNNDKEEETASSKGIKASTTLRISGGEVTVDSTGHCIHSSGTALISGDANLTLRSESGKGFATHGDLQIDGGEISVTYSYEGLESKRMLTINGGNISVYATDDGLNAGGTNEEQTAIIVNGGNLTINAAGDGIDSNGDIVFNGGTTVVAGPQDSGNGPLDCGDRSSIYTNGGTMIAYGAVFQANADNPESTSKQCCIRVGLSARAGTVVTLSNSKGEVLCELTLEKSATNIYISLPSMEQKETYTVRANGSEISTLTMNSVFVSDLSGMMGMGGGRPGGRR